MSDARKANRDAYPTVAAMVDRVRKVFPSAKLLHGVEPDGREVGKVPEYLKEATR